MGGHYRRVCELCGEPIGVGTRRRLLGQRESGRAKFTESGWALYTCNDCMDALEELIAKLRREP